jgi:hypothetical protein
MISYASKGKDNFCIGIKDGLTCTYDTSNKYDTYGSDVDCSGALTAKVITTPLSSYDYLSTGTGK